MSTLGLSLLTILAIVLIPVVIGVRKKLVQVENLKQEWDDLNNENNQDDINNSNKE